MLMMMSSEYDSFVDFFFVFLLYYSPSSCNHYNLPNFYVCWMIIIYEAMAARETLVWKSITSR